MTLFWHLLQTILKNEDKFGPIWTLLDSLPTKLDLFIAIWINLEQFEAISRFLDIFGAIQSHLEPLRVFLSQLKHFGVIWNRFQPFQVNSSHLKIFGGIWWNFEQFWEIWSSLKQKKLKRNQVDPFLIFINRIELFRLNERVIEDKKWIVKQKIKKGLHALEQWFCKESQCNYVHTDKDCYIHLQG